MTRVQENVDYTLQDGALLAEDKEGRRWRFALGTEALSLDKLF